MTGRLTSSFAHAPTAGAISSPFGRRVSAQTGEPRQHNGVDILPTGDGPSPVYAVLDGEVTHATENGARGFACYGRVVVVHHPQADAWLLYGHLADSQVSPGDVVRAGDVLGHIGETNGSVTHPGTTFADGACLPGGRFTPSARSRSGPHLHLEVSRRAYPQVYAAPRLDPIPWLASWGIDYTVNGRGGRPVHMASRRRNQAPADAPDSAPAGPPPRPGTGGAGALLVAALLFGGFLLSR